MTRTLLLLTLALSTSLTACQSPSAPPAVQEPVSADESADAAPVAPPAASSPAAQFLSREPDALVVDVRTPAEYASGHVVGARNVDVNGGDFAAALDSVDRARPVYVYCRTGNRSERAKETLTEMGFERVVNAGGFDDLAAAGASTE